MTWSHWLPDIVSTDGGTRLKLIEIAIPLLAGLVGGSFLFYDRTKDIEARVEKLTASYSSEIDKLSLTMSLELKAIKEFMTIMASKDILPGADKRLTIAENEIHKIGDRLAVLEAFKTEGHRFTEARGRRLEKRVNATEDNTHNHRTALATIMFRLDQLEQYQTLHSQSQNHATDDRSIYRNGDGVDRTATAPKK